MLNSLGGEPLQPAGEQGQGGQSDLLTYLLPIQVASHYNRLENHGREDSWIFLLTYYTGGDPLQPAGEQGPGGQGGQ